MTAKRPFHAYSFGFLRLAADLPTPAVDRMAHALGWPDLRREAAP